MPFSHSVSPLYMQCSNLSIYRHLLLKIIGSNGVKWGKMDLSTYFGVCNT